MHSLREAAATDLRAALAEGDISAILLTNYGREEPISKSRWRANDGLTCVQTGRIDVQLPFGIGPTKGQALIKEEDFIAWLPTAAPKKFSQVGVSVIAQDPLPQATMIKPPIPRLAREDSTESLPLWLTPMETVAWIVARHPHIVGYASPKRNAVRAFVIDHVLPNGKRVSGEDALPAGMSLIWLDLFATCDATETIPTGEALEQLHAALQSGRITARATWAATRERRDMGADEWRNLVLETLRDNHRFLLPHRVGFGSLATRPDRRWGEVQLPRDGVIALWPALEQELQVNERPQHPIIAAPSKDQRGYHADIPDAGHQSRPKPPVSWAALAQWYTDRRDEWTAGRKHPSQDEDLSDAKQHFPDHNVTREAVRTVRSRFAPQSWTVHGRRKLAPK
jgi:hypothetical protein